MTEVGTLTRLIQQGYGVPVLSLHLLSSKSETRVYQVKLVMGSSWVVRAYLSADNNAITHLATILLLLERGAYPAERLICTLDGSISFRADGWQLLITTFIEGRPLDYAPCTLKRLGAALGCLHSFDAPADCAVPPARMLPAPEIAYALGQLQHVEQQLPTGLHRRYDTLLVALHAIELDNNDLLAVVIHGDCHPGNAIHQQTGQVVFVDWEAAGQGPAVIDMGFLLASCDTKSPWIPTLPPDPQRVAAIVDGYCQHRVLNPAELAGLPNAIRFRAIVYGACSFAAAIAQNGREEPSQWWWTRYNAAGEIAERARLRFELHLKQTDA